MTTVERYCLATLEITGTIFVIALAVVVIFKMYTDDE